MANQFDVYAAQVPAGSVVHNTVDPALVKGRVRTLISTWVSDGAEGATPSLNVGVLPLGARVLDTFLVVKDVITSGDGQLGDADDANRYLTTATVSLAALGKTGVIEAVTGIGYKIATEAQRTLILDITAGTPATGDSVVAVVTYVLD